MAKEQTQNAEEVNIFVSSLIERYGKKLGVNIDPKNPTRESKLELALKMEESEINPWYGMELMVGRRIDSRETQYAMLMMTYKMGGMDKIKFYDGFA